MFIKFLLNLLSRNRLSILIYHRVREQQDPLIPNEVDANSFDWQMKLISKYFNVLPLSEAIPLLLKNRLPNRSICVTFDDGYADNYETALPILQRYGLTATFFVSTGFLNDGRMWNDTVIEFIRQVPNGPLDLGELDLGVYAINSMEDRHNCFQEIIKSIKHLPQHLRQKVVNQLAGLLEVPLPDNLMMTSDQVKGLSDSGMEVGGHTVTHPILSKLDIDQVRLEILEGKKELERIIGEEVATFAYPNGKPELDYLPEHAEIVKELGFVGAVSTLSGVSTMNTDVFQLRRFTPWDKTPVKFLLRLGRNYLVR